MTKQQGKVTKEDGRLYHAIAFSDDALSCLNPAQAVVLNVRSLVEKKCYHDAVLLLSHSLPKREAVWWASQCARATLSEKTQAREGAAIDLAEEWAMKPDNETRLKVLALGEKIGSFTATGMLAMACGWSAGSITGEDQPQVPPPPYLSAVAVAGAVTLAAAVAPDQFDENYERFIKEGLNIIAGSH